MDTVVRRVTNIDAPDLVIVDEAHHAVARTWSTVLECWPDAYVVGLSATPERLDGRGLAKHFNALVDGPSVFDLITDGYLSRYKMIAPPIGVDTSGLKTVAGDFNRKELGELMDDADLIGSIVDHWERHAKGLKTMGFAVNVKHSRHIVEAFQAKGHRAIHLDAKTPKRLRRQILRDFAEGRYDIVFNVGLFGEGFDLEANANSGRDPDTPYLEVTIEAVISARPTQSLSIWLQQVGRALRPKMEPAVILDHAGNVWVHGLPDADRAWSLNSKKRKKGAAPVKQCPNCYAVVPSASMTCPLCEYTWPPPEGRDVDHQAGELVELDINGMRQRRLDEIAEYRADNEACTTYMQLVELAIKRGSRWPHRWAQHQWEAR
jgi:superfamily II DNA or RNA helicase